jgi:hypothetical protein
MIDAPRSPSTSLSAAAAHPRRSSSTPLMPRWCWPGGGGGAPPRGGPTPRAGVRRASRPSTGRVWARCTSSGCSASCCPRRRPALCGRSQTMWRARSSDRQTASGPTRPTSDDDVGFKAVTTCTHGNRRIYLPRHHEAAASYCFPLPGGKARCRPSVVIYRSLAAGHGTRLTLACFDD